MQKQGIVVLGISKDDMKSHQQFASKYHLSFPLLADTDTQVAQRYGAYGEKSMFGKKFMGVDRKTFLIDKDGIVRKIWQKVNPLGHAEDVLKTVDALKL